LARKPAAGWGGNDNMEGARGPPAVFGGNGERGDDLQLLDDRAGPAVRDDQWQRVLLRRPDVDEMDVESVDGGDELVERIQLRFASAPVVFRGPIVRQVLHRRDLYAL